MRKRLALFTCGIILFIAQTLWAATISGRVTGDDRPTGIGNLNIELFNDDWSYVKGAITEGDGSYLLEGLSPGHYIVEVNSQSRGYVSQTAAIEITADSEAKTADFSLITGGYISGRITDTVTHEGIPDVLVLASNITSGRWLGSATTAADGSYRIPGLPEGYCRVESTVTGSYMAKYYPSDVGVALGEDTPGIDLELAKGGSFSGLVMDIVTSRGIPNLDVQAYIYSAAKEDWIWAGSAVTDKNLLGSGAYTVNGLPAGDYRVEIITGSTPYLGEPYPTLVSVALEQDTPDIDFRLFRGVTISGVVLDAKTKTPVAGINVIASNPTYSPTAGSDGTGYFQIVAKPNLSYRIRVDTAGTDYLDYNRPGMVVLKTEDTYIGSVYLERGGRITGRVVSENGPISSEYLKVMVVNAYTCDAEHDYVTYSLIDPQGRFIIGRLKRNASLSIDANAHGTPYVSKTYPKCVKIVDPTEDTSIGTITLDMGGWIAGRIVDVDNNGISGLTVMAYNSKNGLNVVEDAYTASDGTFRISGLPLIAKTKRGNGPATYKIQVNTDFGVKPGEEYRTSFYNSRLTYNVSTTLRQAEVILLDSNVSSANLETMTLRLKPKPKRKR